MQPSAAIAILLTSVLLACDDDPIINTQKEIPWVVTLYMRERCEQDRWTANAIACVVAATTIPALGPCRSLLTNVQRQELAAEGRGILGELAVELHRFKE